MILSYPQARHARVKSDYVFSEGGMSAYIPLGGQAEVADEIGRAILKKDGDVVKQIGAGPAKAGKPVKAPGKPSSASVAATHTSGAPHTADATGGQPKAATPVPAYAQADLTLEE